MKWIATLKRFRQRNVSPVPQTWIDYDQAQAGTPYWNHITDAKRAYKNRLIDFLSRYPVDYPGKEFILRPQAAANLTNELEAFGIAVTGVGVWCFVPTAVPREKCCPDGMGGPSHQTPEGREWFSEYTHLGYEVPDFEQMSRTRDLASQCNPLIRHYLEHQLPHEHVYNEHFRVSLDLYVPLQWDLFPSRP